MIHFRDFHGSITLTTAEHTGLQLARMPNQSEDDLAPISLQGQPSQMLDLIPPVVFILDKHETVYNLCEAAIHVPASACAAKRFESDPAIHDR